MQSSVAGLQSNVANLQSQISANLRKANEGTAVAIAMGGAALPSDKNYSFNVNWGTYGGQGAFAATAQIRLDERAVISASLGKGLSNGGNNRALGARVGIGFSW